MLLLVEDAPGGGVEMDTEKLRSYCDACLPEQWKALAGADRSKVISGNALVAQGHQMDVNAIVAFANAMPELLDKLETAAAVENTLNGELKARDDTIERLTKDLDAGRELMNSACQEFNSIRARDGAPVGVSHEWWDKMTERLHELLGDDSKPWMTGAAKALLAPAEEALWECEQERDAALAEVEQQRKQIGGLEYHLEAARAESARLKGEVKTVAGVDEREKDRIARLENQSEYGW